MGTSDRSWTEAKGSRFINPYNFVRIEKDIERSEGAAGDLTGKISCTLRVRTPLVIPDDETKKPDPGYERDPRKPTDIHYMSDFFRIGDTAVIPGSQLKGMVRTYFESLSNSCLLVNNDNILSSRHNAIRNPGLICWQRRNDPDIKPGEDKFGWVMYAGTAEKPFRGAAAAPVDTGIVRYWHSPQRIQQNGRLVTRDLPNELVFHSTGDIVECVNLDDAVADYAQNIKLYEANNGNNFKKKKSEYTYGIRKAVGEYSPVFYELVKQDDDSNIVYLSPAQISRSVYRNRIDDLLGAHASCCNGDGRSVCKACALFGMIPRTGGQDKLSRASHVRFSDAAAVEGTFRSERYVTLKPLSSPKTTAVEFYTEKPEGARYWNYDYKVTSYAKSDTRNPIPTRELFRAELRGRKFYVHDPKFDLSRCKAEKSNQNSSHEICTEGEFRFDVFFENITQEQLHELVWTLALGENSADSDRMFKLGHGKSLGLGSVKITVDSVETRYFNADTLQCRIDRPDPGALCSENPFDAESDSFKDMMAIVDFRYLEPHLDENTVVSYPLADDLKGRDNSKAAHQWFTANRSAGKGGTSTAWSVKYTLPRILDEKLSLPKFELSGAKKAEQHSGSKRDNAPAQIYNDPKDSSFSMGGIRSKQDKHKDKKKK